jgi:glycosyltransferase involved in cell wall biosynthesis
VEPTVSVLMPAFNAAGTIAPAIRSVLAQTRPDFELIVVDDGSTDGTGQVVEPFLEDGRIALVTQENRGLAGARNTALARARGRYVSLLDSDDLWLPTYLEAVLALLAADSRLAFAYPDAWVLDEASSRIRRATYRQLYELGEPPREPIAFLHRLVEVNFVLVAATVDRRLVEEAGGYDESLRAVEDYDLWLRLAARGHIGGLVAGAHVVYRERGDSLTRDQTLMATCLREVYRRVEEEYDVPDDVRALARRRRQRHEDKLAMLSGRRPFLAVAYGLRSRARSVRRSMPWAFRRSLPAELTTTLRDV